MKHSLHTVLTLLFVCASAWGENVPWQNPQINEINREPAHAHFIPYTNEANALKQQALPAAQRFAVNPATERRISLDGTWKFLFSKNNEECPTDFYKMGLNKTKSVDELREMARRTERTFVLEDGRADCGPTHMRTGSLRRRSHAGNGEIGEVITPNARTFINIPTSIPYKGQLILRGEAVISYSDFEKLNDSIADVDAKYKNPRNLSQRFRAPAEQ